MSVNSAESSRAGEGYASLTADDVVIGEGVALDLPPAGLGSRIVSALLDALVLGVTLAVITWLMITATLRTNGALLHIGFVSILVITFLVVPTTVETLSRGRSLGKAATGLRVVREDGGPIGFQQAFVRALLAIVEIYAFSGVPAFFSALFSGRGKRLGDYAAGTYVIQERNRLRLPPPPQMPAHLAAWAAAADISAPPIGLSLGIRQLLQRWNQLTPASRDLAARRLADRLGAHVSPAAPPGTHPVDFLCAVLAARRDRDLARLAREQELRRRLSGGGSTDR